MTDDFAAPPAPGGIPAAQARREDFRPAAPRRRRRRFPRWLLVVLVAGGLAIVGGVIAQITLTVRNGNLTPAAPGDTGRLHSAQVVSGMCLRSIGDAAGIVVAVDCDEPHAAEAVASYTFSGGAWPGDEAAADEVIAFCASQLAPGGPLAAAAESREWVVWVPSEGTWSAGDRKGLCIVWSEEPWTGRAADDQPTANSDDTDSDDTDSDDGGSVGA